MFRLALHTSLFLALSFPDLFMGIPLCFYLSTVRPVRPPRSHRLQRLAPPASDVLANSLHSSRCPPASGFVHPKSTPSTSRAPLAAASPTPGRWRWPFPPWWLIISDSSLVLSATAPHQSPAVLFSSAAQMIPLLLIPHLRSVALMSALGVPPLPLPLSPGPLSTPASSSTIATSRCTI